MLKVLLAVVFTMLLLGGSKAQESASESTIGYPTVAAALADLIKRDDVQKSVQQGWSIISDPTTKSLWSFTPPGHPAHPSAIVRTITERNGQVFVNMKALCQAKKAACDRLIAEFKALNQRLATHMQGGSRAPPTKWEPTEGDKTSAVALLDRFIAALDGGRFREAYDLFGSRLKAMMSFERFMKLRQNADETAGGTLVRGERRITWYNDPPGASKGVFAAFDIACKVPKQSYCGEVIILHRPPGSAFEIIRQETNFVDPETRRRLPERAR